jgi:ELMO domain-containing protein
MSSLQVYLAKLWSVTFPEEKWKPGPNPRWKDAGFQGIDPASDFRGGGVYSLLNLVYMAQQHNAAFRRLMLKTDGKRAEYEYPFSAAGA